LIIGAGKHLAGTAVSKFLTAGFNILLISRNISKLDKLKANGINNIDVYSADVANSKELKHQFEVIKRRYEKIDVILFNAASISNKSILNECEMVFFTTLK